MSHSFSVYEFVQLPRLTAPETSVLIQELLTVAHAQEKATPGKKLPPPIERSYKRLISAHETLTSALRTQSIGSDADTQAKRKADQALDNAWGSLYDWLSGWCRLPASSHANAQVAQELFTVLFSEKLSFLQLAYKLEWQESQSRLEAIEQGKHENTFKVLGGASFIKHLKEMHSTYGKVLGITSINEDKTSNAEVGIQSTAARDALRDYIMRVNAYADPEEPGSQELAQALLKPLTTWTSTRTRKSASESDSKHEPLPPVD